MKKIASRILGGGLLLLTAATLLWDIVAPDTAPGTPAAQQGFRIGTFIGMGLRTAILGTIGWALFRAPDPSNRATPGDRMRRILATHRQQVPTARPEDKDPYATASDDDLLDVYDRLDQHANPTRFASLLWAMSQRVANHAGEHEAKG